MKMKPLPRSVCLCFLIPFTALGQPPQKVSPQVWQNTAAHVVQGTRTAVPKVVLKAIAANSRDCPGTAKETAEMFEACRIETKGVGLIAVRGGGPCDCSPTGNCSFWVYRSVGDRFVLILVSSMVHHFGFLKFEQYGLPDIVVWSHGSAFESGARLWQFNGKKYVERCSWDAVFREGSEEAQIENNTCEVATEKQDTPVAKP
jgi:hypothetical protein